ncbi:MAG: AraC family transcriptional regulator [Micavibrio sp.]|nr:AraC family transcriptional regulator [Micavibrio sp.]
MSVIKELLSGDVSFSVPEILSLFGCAQCVYILTYLAFRSGRISRGTIPILFFLFLGIAFALDLSESSWAPLVEYYPHLQWFFWFSIAPLSTLLVLQIAQITQVPSARYFLLMFLMPIGYLMAYLKVGTSIECKSVVNCSEMFDWLIVVGIIISAFSLLTVWFNKDVLGKLLQQKRGNERFWLIISIITLNVSVIAIFSAVAYDFVEISDASFVRTFVGFAFVYLAATSLFRIYPQAVAIRPKNAGSDAVLSNQELDDALKIERLLAVEKIYQEPAYGRSDLARELGVTESALSKIVNIHFNKSVPQLLNAYRVEDAKQLLVETDVDLAIVSEEAGFNSITTFNRHFKDLTGVTPSEYRSKKACK